MAYQKYIFHDDNIDPDEHAENENSSEALSSKELGRFATYMILAILCMLFAISSAIKQGLKI